MALHQNNGACGHCLEIVNRYPGFCAPLLQWFQALQAAHPEAHCSCAGRGQQDQEAAFLRRASRAHWGQSSHNYNAALDLFRELPGQNTVDEMFDRSWFAQVVDPAVALQNMSGGLKLDWYGRPGAEFYELPHVEVGHWRALVQVGQLKLVESVPTWATTSTAPTQTAPRI